MSSTTPRFIHWKGYAFNPRRVAAIHPLHNPFNIHMGKTAVTVDLSGGQSIEIGSTEGERAELIHLLSGTWPPGATPPVPPAPARSPSTIPRSP